ncbi:LysM repeat protein [Pelomonas aquatica]|uniref:LysM repeat protein n=1 Tax=Pelomonas aquatica TaxID=431058 RepID=A0ABU1ZEV2_9BURK|nr:LysM peptidoglycan-binding domain-containing protein [Pelomonas aquatica]MDR7298988.1 LysM repeat protein [Pelomonas aquatica]
MTTISRVTPAVTALQDTPPAGRRYEVQHGDSLDRIAADHGVALDALLAANPQLHSPDLVHVGESLYLPEPLSNTVADLLPEPTHGLLHDIPLLALYRFDPSWRRDTYDAAVRVGNAVLTSGRPFFDHVAPEGTLRRDGRREFVADRHAAPSMPRPDAPGDAAVDPDH